MDTTAFGLPIANTKVAGVLDLEFASLKVVRLITGLVRNANILISGKILSSFNTILEVFRFFFLPQLLYI